MKTGMIVGLALSLTLAAAAAQKPNIVFIYGDDIGYGDLGCYGATAVSTPNVDRLAAGGLRFTSAYAAAATCTPSRYALLTGEYAFRQKGTHVLPGDAALIINPRRATVPRMLKQAGYTTAAVGKWHLGLGHENPVLDWNGEIAPGPLEIGFDYAFIMAATGDRVPCVYVENHRVVGLDPKDPIKVSYETPFPGEPTGRSARSQLTLDWSHGHSDAIVGGIPRIGYMTGGQAARWNDADMAKVFTQRALDFIERTREQPFFLYLATQDIHVPRVPNRDFAGKTTMGARGDAIVEFDWMVGEVVKTLERLKLLDNTLIIVSSDNGPVLDDGYKDLANEKLGAHRPAGPFRAGKYSLFEGGTRMPFLTYWRGHIQPGVSAALISQVDLLASLAAFTGQSFDATDAPDTENVLPALLGQSPAGRRSLVEQAKGVALREGDWKFMPPGRVQDGLGPRRTVTVPAPGFLFNLAEDPGEMHNLATAHPEKLQAMREQLQKIRGQSAVEE